jgi:hypothetical protein
MSHMTKLEGVPDRDSVHPGMAYFSGTGPWGATCGKCLHRGYQTKIYDRHGNVLTLRKTKACAIYKQLTGSVGHVVRPEWPACKYFEPIPTSEFR